MSQKLRVMTLLKKCCSFVGEGNILLTPTHTLIALDQMLVLVKGELLFLQIIIMVHP